LILHEQNPDTWIGALGLVLWDPRLKPTPLMEWMNHGGPQNNFDALLGSIYASPSEFFYGSHVSVKRKALANDVFSEEYTQYGHEDHDLGVRLARRGLKLRVLHDAIGLHRHFYAADSFFQRQFAVGRGVRIVVRRLGDESLVQVGVLRLVQYLVYALGAGALLRYIVRFMSTRWSIPRLFAHSAGYEYRRGVLHR
ncbi:MAG: hypothetical protein COU33_01180, partial [Candidatus Magasanikbacteria bacterium CG10_big_fil_rev_8_21_14_0_10_43_6]